jgi:hypothetical protein
MLVHPQCSASTRTLNRTLALMYMQERVRSLIPAPVICQIVGTNFHLKWINQSLSLKKSALKSRSLEEIAPAYRRDEWVLRVALWMLNESGVDERSGY